MHGRVGVGAVFAEREGGGVTIPVDVDQIGAVAVLIDAVVGAFQGHEQEEDEHVARHCTGRARLR
jgi:hypothetical protein